MEFLEWEARERPRRHACRLIALVVLGYSYPLLLLGLAVALVAAVLWLFPVIAAMSADWIVWVYYLLALAAAAGLTAAAVGAFYVNLPTPTGYTLPPGHAPALRAMIEEVRGACDGPAIHHVLLDVRLNAAVTQRPRFGFWGPRTNYLIIGVPLLIAMPTQQFRAVIAHEFAHLRGRHSNFTSWIYRIQHTWEALSAPLASRGWLRWLSLGWFIRSYGQYLDSSTLALRRIHEYEADRAAADFSGTRETALALLLLGLTDYRLGREFWPAVLREVADTPLPPADVMRRMRSFLQGPPPPGLVCRWRARELGALTPITSEHPCLLERLTALGCRSLLEEVQPACDPDASALTLLGDACDRVLTVANASWKAMAAHRWRYEYVIAEQVRERLNKPMDGAAEGREWHRLQVEVDRLTPESAISSLREFIAKFPDHAGANFALGRILLEQDDESARVHLEIALRNDSDYIAPSLGMLLGYYRDLGRDGDAESIQRRLAEHEKALVSARRQRLRVGLRYRLLPHDLPADRLERLRRQLKSYPQIRAAYLARKHVRLFGDKSTYVLAIHRRPRPLDDMRRSDRLLVASLTQQIDFPCAVVVMSWRCGRLCSRIRRACPEPMLFTVG